MHLLLPETGSEGDRNFLLQERQLNFSLNLSTELISMCVLFFFFFWTSCGTLDPVKHVGWSLGCVVHLWKVRMGQGDVYGAQMPWSHGNLGSEGSGHLMDFVSLFLSQS